VNIRKFTGLPLRSLDELVLREMLSRSAADFLRACVRARLSVVFAGPPGSGKTTLLSCCAGELDPGLGIVVAEEVFETTSRCRTSLNLEAVLWGAQRTLGRRRGEDARRPRLFPALP
jgi:Flp pilus assembly CpaF family ATPase